VVPKHEIRKEEKMKISEIMEVGNPYAVGMAQAMKSTGDTPPLKKSTIKKAHEIAKAIDENASAEEEDEFHRKLDKLVHKTFGHSSDEVEEAYTQSAAPGAQLKGNEKAPKAKAGRTDHPHGGRLVGETTSAGAVAAVATPIGTIRKRNQDEVDETTSASGVSVGAPKGKPRNNTGKNALNSKDNLLGEKSRKVRRTKR
jgi:hypothetical protein